MKKCVIIVNGFYTNPSIEHQVSSLSCELKKLGVSSDIVKGNTLFCHISGTETVNELCGYDFGIYLDKDLHAALMLEKGGLRLFNSAKAVELCDDKMLTYITLSNSGIRMPLTVSSPIMYREADDSGFIELVAKKISYPVVVKEVYGSMGMGVHLAENKKQLMDLRARLKLSPHLYQQFIGIGGADKRVITVGGKIVAAMKRVNENDFRSNIEHGGKGFLTELTEEEIFIAETAAEILGLDYGGIDILCDTDGIPYFCEANSNAFFKGIQSVTGVKIAEIYAKYIYESVYG